MTGLATYTDDIPVLHQTRQLLALGPATPQLTGSFIRGNINSTEGQFVRLEDRFNPGGRGDDVRGPRRQGGVEIKG